MEVPLSFWKKIYTRYKDNSLCIDVEATYWDGPISVIGVYKPKDGEIDYQSFVKGINLTRENLKQAFSGCKLLITFNGTKYDVPEIMKQLPGVIDGKTAVLDLYLLAKNLNYGAGLKTLEKTFNISRLESVDNKRKISTKLWNKYEKKKNQKALNTLIEYNRQDTINLYPLAEKLMEMIK